MIRGQEGIIVCQDAEGFGGEGASVIEKRVVDGVGIGFGEGWLLKVQPECLIVGRVGMAGGDVGGLGGYFFDRAGECLRKSVLEI